MNLLRKEVKLHQDGQDGLHLQNNTINLFFHVLCFAPIMAQNKVVFPQTFLRKIVEKSTRIWNTLVSKVLFAEFWLKVFHSRETALESQPYTGLAEPVLTLQ